MKMDIIKSGQAFREHLSAKGWMYTKVVFEDQLTPLGFTGVTDEIFANDRVSVKYFDMNAGLFYNGSTNGFNNFYVGASMYHINRPKESFQGGEFLLSARTTLQAGGQGSRRRS